MMVIVCVCVCVSGSTRESRCGDNDDGREAEEGCSMLGRAPSVGPMVVWFGLVRSVLEELRANACEQCARDGRNVGRSRASDRIRVGQASGGWLTLVGAPAIVGD